MHSLLCWCHNPKTSECGEYNDFDASLPPMCSPKQCCAPITAQVCTTMCASRNYALCSYSGNMHAGCVLWCFDVVFYKSWSILPISFRVTSLTAGQLAWCHCLRASYDTLMSVDTNVAEIYYKFDDITKQNQRKHISWRGLRDILYIIYPDFCLTYQHAYLSRDIVIFWHDLNHV